MADYEEFEKNEGYTADGGNSERYAAHYDNENQRSSYRNNYNSERRSYGGYQRGGRGSYGGYRQGGGYGYRSGGYNRYHYESDNAADEKPQNTYGNNTYGDRPYRSRFNSDREGGYRPRYSNYDYQGEGGQRPRYNSGNYEGGYQRGGYQQRSGYRREGQHGGFQRGSYQQRGGFGRGYNPKRRTAFAEHVADPDAPLRLNKFLANAGVCSRRDADKYIEAGVVKVNGEVVTELGTKVLRTDQVHFHDQLIKPELKIYVLLNKPKGYVTTSEDPENRKTVMDLVRDACPERIYPVGRLDRNTTGVLLFTNDGEMASKLTHPKFLKKKIYHVWLDKNLKPEDARRIVEGITLDDGDIRADDLQFVNASDRKQVGIEIHSGRNRIVRRIFEALDYHVIKLDRVFFAGLTKKNLKRGAWRFLTEQEVNFLRMGAYE